jgi:hypothetical protein
MGRRQRCSREPALETSLWLIGWGCGKSAPFGYGGRGLLEWP